MIVRSFLFFLFFPSFLFAHQLSESGYEIIIVGKKKGLKDATGKIIIPPKYEDLGWSNGNDDNPTENLIGYKQNSKWGLISLTNKKITLPEYAFLNKTKSEYIIGAKSGRLSRSYFYGLFNAKGEIVVPFRYLSMQEENGCLVVSDRVGDEKKYGLITIDNQLLLPFDYVNILTISDTLLSLNLTNGQIQLYNSELKTIVQDSLTNIESWENGYFKIYKGLKCGLINDKGLFIAPVEYKDFVWNEDQLEGLKYPKWNVFSGQNELINTIECDEVAFIDNKILLTATNHHQLLNQQFKPLTPLGFESIESVVGDKVLYRSKNKYGIYDLRKQKHLQHGFDSLRLKDEFLYTFNLINSKRVWAVYDTFGIKRSKFEYEQIRDYDNMLFAVKRRGHWGYMDRNGREVIHCVYDSVGNFIDGNIVVQFHGEQGVIDEESNWVVTPRKAKIEWLKDSLFLSRGKGKTTLEDINGGLIYFTENRLEYKDDLLWEYRQDSSIVKFDLHGIKVNAVSIKKERYENTKFNEDDWVAIKINGSYGFVDKNSKKLRISNRYEDVGNARGDLISVKILGKWGAIDKKENIVVQPNYEEELHFKNGIAIMKLDGYYGIINMEGKEILAPVHQQIFKQISGRYISREKDKYGLVDTNGRVLINNKYNSLQDLGNGYIIIQKGKKFGVTTINGVNTIPQIYNKIIYNPLSDSYFAATNQKWESLTDGE